MRSMVEGYLMLDRSKNAMVMRARCLRREMTLPEALLWRELRHRPGGFKFRRQHPIGDYIVDFYCAAAKLVIEVDGEAHRMGDNPRRDERRDAWFDEQGFRVFRIAARDLLADFDTVLAAIERECGR